MQIIEAMLNKVRTHTHANLCCEF